MVSANIIISNEGARDLRQLGERIKAAGRDDLRKKMRRNIRDAGKPVVADLRSAVMRVKVTRSSDPYQRRAQEAGVTSRRSTSRWGTRSTGLRARTARAIGVSQTRKGIRIKVSAARFGDYGVTLPRYLDTEASPRWKKWRHPVFGNPEVWVEQRGQPWFFTTFSQHRERFVQAVSDAVDEMIRELER